MLGAGADDADAWVYGYACVAAGAFFSSSTGKLDLYKVAPRRGAVLDS